MAYNCDITYVTNNELGFDDLRDNMVIYQEQKVQRPPNFASVDEVDSILIDEALHAADYFRGASGKSTAGRAEICDRFARTLTALAH